MVCATSSLPIKAEATPKRSSDKSRSWQPALKPLFPKDLLVHSGLRITYYIRSGIIFVILASSSSLINLRCVTLKKWSHILFFREGGGMGYATSNCNTTECVTDLDQRSEMTLFESVLTTFEPSFVF